MIKTKSQNLFFMGFFKKEMIDSQIYFMLHSTFFRLKIACLKIAHLVFHATQFNCKTIALISINYLRHLK